MTECLHLTNAKIWTADEHRPWAGSLTIEGPFITALDGEPPEGAEIIDLGGRVVTPGLIDAHVHLLMGGRALAELDLSRVRSRAEFEEAIARRDLELPPGEWLIARGWSDENWSSHENPDKSWLGAAGNRPVVCYRMDHHAAVVNEPVLGLCDLARELVGGSVRRDERGEPTGLMVEAAAWELVNPLIPAPSPARRRQALEAAQEHLLSLGVTSVGAMEYARDVAAVLVPERGNLRVRLFIMLLDRDWPLDFTYAESFTNDQRLAVIGCKSFIDGTLGSRTARLLRDYNDDPGNRGMLVELCARGVLKDWAEAVAARGLQPVMHAIGDEAARHALEALEGVDRACRARIEHAQQLDPVDIPRFRDRIASMQPLHRADDARSVERRVGRDRLAGTFAFRSLVNAGARLAFGSDWPIVSCDPILGMKAAITALTLDDTLFMPEERLSVEETLRAYTRDAAYACRTEHMVGMIRAGMRADLVAFSDDPFAIDWKRDTPHIVLTVADGVVRMNRVRLAVAPGASV